MVNTSQLQKIMAVVKIERSLQQRMPNQVQTNSDSTRCKSGDLMKLSAEVESPRLGALMSFEK
jgi:hypothetical protein